ncbi:urease accessory protein UreF [Azonexus caeni]|jgi:urease accessory protein|uniref:urease accessory protein UreF n=1 Tax=Azonexus caeni TaxID=266126 RepID=UPI003A8841DC
MNRASSSLQLARLLQLASPALPVGAYTYSQGLEWAVESGIVSDEASAGAWISDLLAHGIGRYEAPLVAALIKAWTNDDTDEVRRLDGDFLASRETAELRAETAQMGFSLRRLLRDLRDESLAGVGAVVEAQPEVAFPTVWAGIAAAWKLAPAAALTAYLWAWAENQVMAALKAVPLGQAAGQRLLADLGARLPAIAEAALTLPEAAWSNFTPAFAIACARHETQYSRLFRS